MHNLFRDIQHSLFRSRWCQNDLPNTYVLKFPSKLLLGKDMFTFTLVDLEYETSVSIWEFEMMIVLTWLFCLHFSSLHDYIHKTQMKLGLLMNSDTLNCLWILAFPIGIIQVSTPRKWSFLLYFSSFHDYWPPTTLISLVHNSLSKMESCE